MRVSDATKTLWRINDTVEVTGRLLPWGEMRLIAVNPGTRVGRSVPVTTLQGYITDLAHDYIAISVYDEELFSNVVYYPNVADVISIEPISALEVGTRERDEEW